MLITRLTTEQDVRAWIADLNSKGNPVALDVETTGLDPWTDKLLSIVLTGSDTDTACCFDPLFAPLLIDLAVGLILHNFKFDYQFLYRNGVDLRNHDFRDTMLLHHLMDENLPHDLDSIITEKYQDTYKSEFWATYKTFSAASETAQDEYAGKDVIYTLRLYYDLKAALQEAGIPTSLIKQTHDFALHLLNTEIEGICIDLNHVKHSGLKTLLKIDTLETKMSDMVKLEVERITRKLYEVELGKRKTEKGKANVKPPEFNYGSPVQLQSLLYEELNLPRQLSPQRKVTVDDNALSKLEDLHPFVKLLREYRGEQKLFTAFLETALDKSREGRIYPSFNVNGTVTGRISASNPNLQQLPASGGIRGMYVPRPGYVFISADYSQLEVTIAAHFSRDPNLLRVITDGVSLHDITAEGLGIERSLAKTVNFAIQYGAGIGKLKKILRCGDIDAQEALQRYWDTYPGLKVLIDKCHACVDQGKAIANPFGRQRRLKADNPKDKWQVAAVKRQAFNSLIQGTGADITNTAFTQLSEEIALDGVGRGLLVVHDEILLECRAEWGNYWNTRVKEIMVNVGSYIGLTVPLSVETSGPMPRWED